MDKQFLDKLLVALQLSGPACFLYIALVCLLREQIVVIYEVLKVNQVNISRE